MKSIIPFADYRNFSMHITDINTLREEIEDNIETVIRLVRDTVNTYNRNTRSTDGRACMYSFNGRMCAVGRCLTPEGLELFHNQELKNTFSIDIMPMGLVDDLDSVMQEQYKGIPVEVWKVMQNLHDHDDNWDDNGINALGKRYIYITLGTEIHNRVFENTPQ